MILRWVIADGSMRRSSRAGWLGDWRAIKRESQLAKAGFEMVMCTPVVIPSEMGLACCIAMLCHVMGMGIIRFFRIRYLRTQ